MLLQRISSLRCRNTPPCRCTDSCVTFADHNVNSLFFYFNKTKLWLSCMQCWFVLLKAFGWNIRLQNSTPDDCMWNFQFMWCKLIEFTSPRILHSHLNVFINSNRASLQLWDSIVVCTVYTHLYIFSKVEMTVSAICKEFSKLLYFNSY